MTETQHDRRGRRITLRPVDAENWRAVADIAPRDDQREFVAALAARYLLLSEREGEWTSLGVYADDTAVGHLMWAHDEDEKAHWVGGMVVDAAEQGAGVGRAALTTLMGRLAALPDCREIRLSYDRANTAAAALYASLGFVPTGDSEGEEIVAGFAC